MGSITIDERTQEIVMLQIGQLVLQAAKLRAENEALSEKAKAKTDPVAEPARDVQ